MKFVEGFALVTLCFIVVQVAQSFGFFGGPGGFGGPGFGGAGFGGPGFGGPGFGGPGFGRGPYGFGWGGPPLPPPLPYYYGR